MGGRWLIRAGLALMWLLVAAVFIWGLGMLALGFGVVGNESSQGWDLTGAFRFVGFLAILGSAALSGFVLFASRHPTVAGTTLVFAAVSVLFLVFWASPSGDRALVFALTVGLLSWEMRTALAPWVGWLGLVCALALLFAVFRFPLMALPIWTIATSVALLRSKEPAPA